MGYINVLDENTFNKINNRLGAINGALIPLDSNVKVIDSKKGWLVMESPQAIEYNHIIINYGCNIGDEIILKPKNHKGTEELKNWFYGKPFKIGSKMLYVNNALLITYKDKFIIDIDLMNKDGFIVGGVPLPSEFLELIK